MFRAYAGMQMSPNVTDMRRCADVPGMPCANVPGMRRSADVTRCAKDAPVCAGGMRQSADVTKCAKDAPVCRCD
eukprot:9470174-Pyramimonas_sp.AAC.2